jgi:xanthine dehydrogenase accessory factor
MSSHNRIIADEIIYEEILNLKRRAEPGVLITVVQKEGSGPTAVGTKLLCGQSGRIAGTVGGGELEHRALARAAEVIREGRSCIQSYTLDPLDEASSNRPDLSEGSDEQLGMLCGGKIVLFFDLIAAAIGLYLFGGGHIGQALINHLNRQIFHVFLIENRKEILQEAPDDRITKILTERYTDGLADLNLSDGAYVVIATHSHELDYQILKVIVAGGGCPAYIGVVASRKKAAAMVDRLKGELRSAPDLSNLYMPVGLDLGGQTPDEISFSILAEIQAHRHGKQGHCHMRGNWKEG